MRLRRISAFFMALMFIFALVAAAFVPQLNPTHAPSLGSDVEVPLSLAVPVLDRLCFLPIFENLSFEQLRNDFILPVLTQSLCFFLHGADIAINLAVLLMGAPVAKILCPRAP